MSSLDKRILSTEFEQALASGMLEPLLSLIKRDRDLNAEIRTERLDVYCKGNRLISVTPAEGGSYSFQSDAAFWSKRSQVFHKKTEIVEFSANIVPFIKQKISEHSAKGKEIEFEQMVIRSCNREPLYTDYIAVDRQGLADGGLNQMDILGVFWPGRKRPYTKMLAPALIEVKYALTGGVEGIAAQIERYYEHVAQNLSCFVSNLQAQLRQKARLGLLAGLSKKAQEKIKTLPMSERLSDLRLVIALVDCSPHAERLSIARMELQKLDFCNQIEIYHLGLGMWEQNSCFRRSDVLPDQSLQKPQDRLGTLQSEEGEILFEDIEGIEAANEMRHDVQQRNLRELASFEAIFMMPGFRFATWHMLPLTEAIGCPPYWAHSEDAKTFIKYATAVGLSISFDCAEWLTTEEAQTLCENAGCINSANYDQLVKLLTSHILNDRVNPGALNAAFESGILTEIVQRAQALVEG